MKRVSSSEYDILTITRALVGQESLPAVEGLLRRQRVLPDKMGPTSMAVLRDTLAKGCVLQLARRGGWQPVSHLSNGKVAAGRVWQRHRKLQLRFSRFAIELIRWLASSPVANAECPPLTARASTAADELLMYLAIDLTRTNDLDTALVRQVAFRGSALCWLGFPDRLSRDTATPAHLNAEWFNDFIADDGVIYLEALQQDLARKWMAMEWGKKRIRRSNAMHALGDGQDQVVRAYLAAVDAIDRRDLAHFMMIAAAAVLQGHAEPTQWIGNLEKRGSMRERTEARQAAGAFLRNIRQLAAWAGDCGSVRFFDDEYDAAQLYLTQWETVGDDGLRHAERVLSALDALDAGVAEPSEGASQ